MDKLHKINKSHIVNFRLTEKEYKSIGYDMQDMGISSVSEYIRSICLKNPNRKNLLITKNYLVSEFQELINSARKDNGNFDNEKLDRLEETLWEI